jgi:hypothetical protein
MLLAVTQHQPEPVDAVCPQMQPELSRLIMRLLAKDRERRPQSAEAVADALSEIESRRTVGRTDPEQGQADKPRPTMWRPHRRSAGPYASAA